LLTYIQQVIDPKKENAELSAAIDKAENIENEGSNIAQILNDCGIYALSLSDFGCAPRYNNGVISADVDYIYVSEDDVWLVIENGEPMNDTWPLNATDNNYTWIVEKIKAAANKAYKEAKKMMPTV
jgi:hypothetical protein